MVILELELGGLQADTNDSFPRFSLVLRPYVTCGAVATDNVK